MSPAELIVELVRRFDAGRYEEALALFAEDPREKDGVTLDQIREFADRRVTHGRTVARVEADEAPVDADHVRARVHIEYRDGSVRDADLVARRLGDEWRLTPHGSLL
jgi:hypothetical protein